MSSPESFLSRPLLRQLAGDAAYAAGEEAAGGGKVRHAQFGADRVTAKVADGRQYRVKIWRGRGELHFACSCPEGSEHVFCWHCVAVGLTWVQSAERAGTDVPTGSVAGPGTATTARTREKLRRHLQTTEHARLVNLLLEATDYDDILRRRLLMETAGVAGATQTLLPDFAAYRQILHHAIDAPDYVDYDGMPDYVHGVAEAIHPLGELLRAGHAEAVIDFVELALVALDEASDMIDASDGSLNPVYDDLQRLHLQASRVAGLAPEKLAARLLNFELDGGLGVFNNAVKTYADILGPKGLAAWRTLLVREWSGLPTLDAHSEGDEKGSLDHRRFQIRALMETVAIAEGDHEILEAIKRKDLSSPHDFLSLAEWHLAAGRASEAVRWAEDGRRVFTDPAGNGGLREFLIAAYHDAGRHAEAVALIWDQFTRSQSLEQYQQLKRSASETADGWPVWRVRALQLTSESQARQVAFYRQRGWENAPDQSLLVEFLLDDDADEDAWQEAKSGGCSDDLWLQLADRREAAHPADALEVYQARLTPTIAQGGLRAYQEAITLLTKISTLLEDLGRAAEYDLFRAEVRATHRQKRNFVKLLDASGH